MDIPALVADIIGGLDWLYPESVTFQAPSIGSGDGYANASGLASLGGRLVTVGKSNSDEDEIWAEKIGATHFVQLQGYYPTVAYNMRAVIGGVYYAVLENGIKHPSKALTVVALQSQEKTA